jgi:peptidoglycan/xylan/chitin deacetylase (PgdA/CDA1 family)
MNRAVRSSRSVRSGLANVLWATGIAAGASKALATRGRFALLLHGISGERLPDLDRLAQPHLTSSDLAVLLTWLKERFALLTPEEFLAAETPGVLLTFDDGFANNLTYALPVLHSFKAPAVFFVSTQHVLSPRDWLGFVRMQAESVWGSLDEVPDVVARDWYDGMSVAELTQCAADPLITIGSHGVTHTLLTQCDDTRLAHELRESKVFLEKVTKRTVTLFAYPHGDYDARVAHETRAAGYTAAFAIDPIGVGAPFLELPRVGVYQVDRPYLSLKLSGLHRRPLPIEDPEAQREVVE